MPTPHVQYWRGGAGRRSGAAFAGARSLLSRQRSPSLSASALALAVLLLASLVRSRRKRVAARRLAVGAPLPGSARVRSDGARFTRAVTPAARARARFGCHGRSSDRSARGNRAGARCARAVMPAARGRAILARRGLSLRRHGVAMMKQSYMPVRRIDGIRRGWGEGYTWSTD